MRRLAVWHHDFRHDQHTVLTSAVGENGDRLQHAIRALAFRLLRGATIEAPVGQVFELRKAVEFLNLSFAAEAGQRRVAIEPDVFEFEFRHIR